MFVLGFKGRILVIEVGKILFFLCIFLIILVFNNFGFKSFFEVIEFNLVIILGEVVGFLL